MTQVVTMHDSTPESHAATRWLGSAQTVLLLLPLGLAPLAYGAVVPWMTALFEALLGLALLLWITETLVTGGPIRVWTPLVIPAAVFAAVVLWQYVSGHTAYRYATLQTMLLWAAYGIVLFLVPQVLLAEQRLPTVAAVLQILGFCSALFAVAYLLTANGRLYWVLEMPPRANVFGTYVNHNHYAGLIELLLPWSLVLGTSGVYRGGKQALALFAAMLMGATVFLSGSRGGMIALAVQIAVFLLLRPRGSVRLAYLLPLALLLCTALLFWVGGQRTFERMATMDDSIDQTVTNVRYRVALDGLKVFAAHPVAGWGLGTWPWVYPRYQSFYANVLFDKAHNDYVQLLAETGALGFAAALAFLILLFARSARVLRMARAGWQQSTATAAIVACTGIVVHSMLDFNLQIPANGALFFAMAALATALPSRRAHAQPLGSGAEIRGEARRADVLVTIPSRGKV